MNGCWSQHSGGAWRRRLKNMVQMNLMFCRYLCFCCHLHSVNSAETCHCGFTVVYSFGPVFCSVWSCFHETLGALFSISPEKCVNLFLPFWYKAAYLPSVYHVYVLTLQTNRSKCWEVKWSVYFYVSVENKVNKYIKCWMRQLPSTGLQWTSKIPRLCGSRGRVPVVLDWFKFIHSFFSFFIVALLL